MNELDYKRPIWRKLVTKEVNLDLSFLAAKILLFSTQRTVTKNPSETNIEKAKEEIFSLYMKNKDLPSAKKDIELLLTRY